MLRISIFTNVPNNPVFGISVASAKGDRSPRPFKYVLVAEPDRLGRNLFVVANLLHELEGNGVYVYFAGLGHDSRLADYRLMLTLRTVAVGTSSKLAIPDADM